MLKLIGIFFYKIAGWKINDYVPPETNRCVIIGAPHTSNWDFPISRLGMAVLGIPVRFTIKKEWMGFPFGYFFRALGAIAIDRSPKEPGESRKSMVDAMADLFKTHQRLAMMVTPEGTRSKVSNWKSGFYHIALKADVPIALGFFDYEKKIAGIGKLLYPTGDYEKDLLEIMSFYDKVQPRHPEKFSCDQIYLDAQSAKGATKIPNDIP